MKNTKEQPIRQEPPLIVDITLTRGLLGLLALALVTTIFLGTLAWGQKQVAADTQASQAAFAGMRKYYLTRDFYAGNETLTACAPGYHMASLWEILDTTNLQYDIDLGIAYPEPDNGAGPPPEVGGWIRTGWESNATGSAGYVNCSAWTTDADTASGTVAWLPAVWTGDLENMHVWSADNFTCDLEWSVWCVED